jgi:dipeptide transport system ATP-binding protein
LPEHNLDGSRLAALPGRVPGAHHRPPGCLFAPRCAYRQPPCTAGRPPLATYGGADPAIAVRCLYPLPHAHAAVEMAR